MKRAKTSSESGKKYLSLNLIAICMKAYVSGGHYHLHIDEAKEFPSLLHKCLETSLQKDSDGSDLGKKVRLSYDAKAREHSIDFFPPKAFWDKLKKIHVILTNEQYQRLGRNRLEVIRFGGSSSIDLYLEDDIESLM